MFLSKDHSDPALVDQLSGGRIDLFYGRRVVVREDCHLPSFYSALDIFGGTQVEFDDLVKV